MTLQLPARALLMSLALLGAVALGALLPLGTPMVLGTGSELLRQAGELGSEILLPAALLVLVLLPLVFALSAEWLVIGALALLLFSRVLVWFGAPSILNYAHFGLAVPAVVTLLRHQRSRTSSIVLGAGMVGLGIVVIVSVAANGSYPLRAALFWISIIEPFLFLALMTQMEEASRRRIRGYLIAFAVVQPPFMALQFLRYGMGDGVQGTLMGQGAGHHVLGAIGVIAAITLVASSRRVDRFRWLCWGLALVFLLMGVLSGARQVYVALALAAVPVALSLFHRRTMWLLPWLLSLGLVAVVGFFALGASIHPALAKYSDFERSQAVVKQKLERVQLTVATVGWRGSFLGLGPGNGLSRVALTTVRGYGNLPTVIVGSEAAELAQKYIIRLRSVPQSVKSSASSPYASWLGIYADVGLLGLAMYLVLCVWAWGTLSGAAPGPRRWGRLLLLLGAVLGAVFTWLEEPAFTVYLAAAIGTFLNTSRQGRVPSPEAGHSGEVSR